MKNWKNSIAVSTRAKANASGPVGTLPSWPCWARSSEWPATAPMTAPTTMATGASSGPTNGIAWPCQTDWLHANASLRDFSAPRISAEPQQTRRTGSPLKPSNTPLHRWILTQPANTVPCPPWPTAPRSTRRTRRPLQAHGRVTPPSDSCRVALLSNGYDHHASPVNTPRSEYGENGATPNFATLHPIVPVRSHVTDVRGRPKNCPAPGTDLYSVP